MYSLSFTSSTRHCPRPPISIPSISPRVTSARISPEQLREGVQNALVYGRFERRSPGVAGDWSFSGHPAVTGSQDPHAAVRSLNREGIEVVGMTESGAPGDMARSNLYIVGRYIGEPFE